VVGNRAVPVAITGTASQAAGSVRASSQGDLRCPAGWVRLSRTSAAKGGMAPSGRWWSSTTGPASRPDHHRHRRGDVVADGKDVNDVRIFEVMNRDPAVMDAATAIR
jgi:hypothetical protein